MTLTLTWKRYFLKYWRANHDVTVLIDTAHKMCYATKYFSKYQGKRLKMRLGLGLWLGVGVMVMVRVRV